MARCNQGSKAASKTSQKISLILGSAVASLALASCAASAPPAQVSYTKAQSALDAGKADKAIPHAEAAVLASPRDPEFRATLGTAYLEAGRYASAATAFGEAIELGDNRGRTILSYALTSIANGDKGSAVNKLQAHQNSIPDADLGLALALAGKADLGVEFLVNSIRSGKSSPKSRQNLAYAYALAGNWRAARVMASEDVPPHQLDARLSEWAASARPEDHMKRVSNLLGLAPAADAGLPQHLALANFPTNDALVAEAEQLAAAEPVPAPVPAASPAPAAPRQSEAMALNMDTFDAPVLSNARASALSEAMPAPAVSVPAARSAPRFVSNAVVQNVPRSAPAPRVAAPKTPARTSAPAPRSSVARGSADTHLIQLGAFDTRQVAEQKWSDFKRRYPSLKGHDLVVTEAEVNGRTFFRVAAAGFGSRSARSMCSTVKASGGGCFAYAKSSPPAGAVDRGVRVAARTR